MTNLTCTQARALLMAWLDSELDAMATVSVGEHLAGCSACAERFERESRLEQALGGELRADRMPDDVWARIQESLRQEGAEVAAPTRPGPRATSPFGWRWLAAAAVALVALGLALHDPGVVQRDPFLVHAADAWRAMRDGALPSLSSPEEVRALLQDNGFGDVDLPASGRTTGHPVELLGARLEVLQGVRAVQVAYTCCDVPTSVFLVSEVDLGALPEALRPPAVRSRLTEAEVDGLQARTITAGDVWVGVLGEHHLALADFWVR